MTNESDDGLRGRRADPPRPRGSEADGPGNEGPGSSAVVTVVLVDGAEIVSTPRRASADDLSRRLAEQMLPGDADDAVMTLQVGDAPSKWCVVPARSIRYVEVAEVVNDDETEDEG